MARSLLTASLASWLVGHAAAATVTHDFNITWVTRNPDGMMDRPVIGINNEWPIPVLNFTKGDNVIINVHNQVSVPNRMNLVATKEFEESSYDRLVPSVPSRAIRHLP